MKIKKETKKSKQLKLNSIKQEVQRQEFKPIDKNSCFIPRSETCFNHGGNFWLKFSFSRQTYSLKNNLFYYTEKEKDRKIFICSPCLRKIYFSDKRKEFLSNFKNLSKKIT